MEAKGVELSSVLTARKLLILGTATTAKKTPLPNPLYVYCMKMVLASEPLAVCQRAQYPTNAEQMHRIHSICWPLTDEFVYACSMAVDFARLLSRISAVVNSSPQTLQRHPGEAACATTGADS